jgi:transcriptional regulator with XRE-family HTH domain
MALSEEKLRVIGTRVAIERTRLGLTQGCLAAMLGLTSHSHISRVECGKKTPSLSMLDALSEIFEVEMNYFFTKL